MSLTQVLSSAKAANSTISINAIVRRTLDLSQVGHLVKGCGSLILSMACAAESREVTEIERAVDHKALRREGIGENSASARVIYI